MVESAEPAAQSARIAVLMLCHKHAEHALASIETMRHERHLITQILVGDNSCDPHVTTTLAASTLNFEHIVFETNTGFAAGVNSLMQAALATSEADYFLVVNDDTLLEPDCLANLLAASAPDRIASPMIVSSDDERTVIQSAGDFDRDLVRYNNHFAGLDRSHVAPEVQDVELTDGCCFLIHRQWPQAGLLMDPGFFVYFEDVDYFLRLRERGVRFSFVATAVVQHHKSSSTGGPDTISPLREYYFNRNRLILARKLHAGPKRWRVYAVLIRLALVNLRGFRKHSPQAAKAVVVAILHFFQGRRGAYMPVHEL